MKDLLSFCCWLTLLVMMVFLGGCAAPESAITKTYEIEQETDDGHNILVLIFDADVDSKSTVKQDAKTDARTKLDAALAQTGSTQQNARENAGAVMEGIKSVLGAAGSEKKEAAAVVSPDVVAPPIVTQPAGETTENGLYWGRHNGDRATWYFTKSMTAYPDIIYLTVDGCVSGVKVKTTEVDHEGNPRFVIDGYIVKQSDVSGRGMAVVAPSSCLSEKASIAY